MKTRQFSFVFLFLFLSFLCLRAETREISVKEGASRIIKCDKAREVTSSKTGVAGATILSEEEIIVEGKKAGTAVISITGAKGAETVVVNVKKSMMNDLMVEVDVQILEIIHSDEGNFGIDWPTLLNGAIPDKNLPISPLNILEQPANTLKLFNGTFNRGRISLLVDFLVKNNYAKVLAKPKLLTANGKKARFMSGGEVPLVTVNNQGQAAVEWKKYGVGLDINPEIDKQNNIKAELRAEVSNLDYANAVSIGTSTVPAIKTRWAETNIIVEPENTVVIAGLIENQEVRITEGVPVLSLIPLLGELFKSTKTQNKRTELVIFVTPKISGQESM